MNSSQNPQYNAARTEIYLLIHRFIGSKRDIFTYEQITNEIKDIMLRNGLGIYANSFYVKDCINETIMQLVYSRKLIIRSAYYEPVNRKGKTLRIQGIPIRKRRAIVKFYSDN